MTTMFTFHEQNLPGKGYTLYRHTGRILDQDYVSYRFTTRYVPEHKTIYHADYENQIRWFKTVPLLDKTLLTAWRADYFGPPPHGSIYFIRTFDSEISFADLCQQLTHSGIPLKLSEFSDD